ncbi:MAG: transglycosylase domain-containing protein [Peptoniphilus sp.]|nr:transglycosylase domain-containing protein [Peptoniphilus sp.]MDY3118597.1 transglycosylase domain-containing protein [Peptoniphilus sp.]
MRIQHTLKHKKTWQLIFIGLVFFFVLLAGTIGAWIVSILRDLPAVDFDDLTTSIPQTSYIVDTDGEIIDEVDPSVFSENIAIEDVPEKVKEAFLAVEDRSFYSHHGLDPRQLAASLIANVKSGSIARGGSTITQQLVKNVYLSGEQSLDRKIKEAYLTLGMERHLRKDAILQAYLNRVDLGLGSQGIEAASNAYFSKHAKDLTLEEGALLAGIVKSPATYQPVKRIPAGESESGQVIATQTIGDRSYDLVQNPRAMERKNLVLKLMAQAGYLTDEQAKAAAKTPIVFQPYRETASPYTSYVADAVSDEAVAILAKINSIDRKAAEKLVREGGLTIYSTIVGDYQKKMDALYDDYPSLVAKGANKGAHFVDFKTDEKNRIVDDDGSVLYYPYEDFFDDEGNMHLASDAFVKNDDSLKVDGEFFTTSGGNLLLKNFYYRDTKNNLRTVAGASTVFQSEDLKDKNTLLIRGDVLEEYKDAITVTDEELVLPAEMFQLPDKGSLQPQSAALITDNETGAIVALSGGNDARDPARLRYNHLTSKRQPGRAIIPLTTYLAALTEGDTLAASYDDTPLRIDGDIWPRTDSYYGYDVLADGVSHTRLAMSGKILEHYGFDPVLKNLSRLGLYGGNTADDAIKTPKEDAKRHDLTYDALAGGNFVDGVNLVQLLDSYRHIASPVQGGAYTVQKITDRKGQILYEHPKPKIEQQPDSDILLRYALSLSPLARNLKEDGYDAFAVSGTNKYNADTFAIGATPRYSYGLWMGNDLQKLSLSNNPELTERLYASLVAIAEDTSTWHLPSSYEMHEVSDKTGLLATNYARRAHSTVTLPFIPNTAPTEPTENYTRKLICSVSGQLASTYCPYETITYGYYFLRPKGYDPDQFDGILPKDYYTLPSDYCQIHTKEWYEQEQQKAAEENRDNGLNDDSRRR